MKFPGFCAAAAAFFCTISSLTACTSERTTSPVRTATEELLISTAADRAAAELTPGVPEGTKVFLDTRYFQGYDNDYAIGAIKDQLLRHGAALVDDPGHADAVIFVRAGALSTDNQSTLIGIPALQFPFLPVGNSISVPEIALFKEAEAKGVAKFSMTGYDAKTGRLIASTDPQFGFSHQTNHTVLLFFSWRSGDALPAQADNNPLSLKRFSDILSEPANAHP
ncbi:MAG TPA: DUF6655 family protein [Rhizomicrobium sp.]|nr:DUF6655 family protein [Rhizomicrobium sp.]